jgi:hypothetical protein
MSLLGGSLFSCKPINTGPVDYRIGGYCDTRVSDSYLNKNYRNNIDTTKNEQSVSPDAIIEKLTRDYAKILEYRDTIMY